MHHAAITPHLRVGMQFCLNCPESFHPYRIELLRVESQPIVMTEAELFFVSPKRPDQNRPIGDRAPALMYICVEW